MDLEPLRILLKDLFYPEFKKLVLFTLIVIMATSHYTHGPYSQDTTPPIEEWRMDYFDYPLKTMTRVVDGWGGPAKYVSIDYSNLAINLIFWYFVTCLIVYSYYKIRNSTYRDFKEFTRPTALNLSLTGLTFLLTGFILKSYAFAREPVGCGIRNYFGFPLPASFKISCGIVGPPPTMGELISRTFLFSIVDLLFWYFVVYLIVFEYSKHKKS